MKLLIQVYEGFRIALRAIGLHKMRSLLTTLGIIIGIVSVTSMITTINGIEKSFDDSMSMLGTNKLMVEKWPWFTNDKWWEIMNRPRITDDIVEPIDLNSKFAIAVAPVVQTGREASYKDRVLGGVFIQASTGAYAKTNDIDLTSGRFYNDLDNRFARPVCVIGSEVATGLFPVGEPLGKVFRLGGKKCQIIGVLAKQGKFMGLMSFDNQVQMPFNTFKGWYGINRRSVSVEVRVETPEDVDPAEDEITGIVRVARGLDATQENDFAINRLEAFRSTFDSMKIAIYGVGLFLTALSLIVGGIGVMNIMFVSVKERTKEIGIRKALGATRVAILVQFLFEAIMVCVGGGLVGIAISVGITMIINSFFTAVLSWGTVFVAFTICAMVGIVFGFIPAWKAAKSNPIDALRYE